MEIEREGLLQEVYDFYNENGHLFIHKDTNKELADFLDDLRIGYNNEELSQNMIDKFNSMGMVWRNVEQAEWEYCYDLAKEYNTMFKTLNMPKTYEYKGIKLGEWVNTQVKNYHKNELSLLRYEKLNDLGLNWYDRFVSKVSSPEQTVAYYVTKAFSDTMSSYRPECLNGKELDIYIPSLNLGIEYDGYYWHQDIERDLAKNKLCVENGIQLIRIREKGCPNMDDDTCLCIQRTRNTEKELETTIEKLLSELSEIKCKNMGLDLDLVIPKQYHINIKADKEFIQKDRNKGIEVKMSFDRNIEFLGDFYSEHKHCVIPSDYETVDGVKLGEWLNTLRTFYKDDKSILTEEQKQYLDEKCPNWESDYKSKWMCNMNKITFQKGVIYIPRGAKTFDGKDLYSWFNNELRKYYNKGTEDFQNNFYREKGLHNRKITELNKTLSKIIRAEPKKNRDLER